MIVRTARIEDARKLLEIYSYYIENTAITFECVVPSEEEFKGRIEETVKNYPFLVAENERTVVGFAYAKALKNRRAYSHSVETSIYVARDCRRQGVGRVLMDNIERVLKAQNVENMYACVAFSDDEDEYLTRDSFNFHEKLGFEPVGVFHNCGYKFNRWYDIVWMEKIIGNHITPSGEFINFMDLKGYQNE